MAVMRGVFAVGFLLGPALLLAGCGVNFRGTDCSVNGSCSKVMKSYNFSEYTELSLESDIDAEVIVGESPSIAVTLYDNVAEYLDLHVQSAWFDYDLSTSMSMAPTVSLGFTASGVCNSGAKAVITVTEPLHGVSSASSGSLGVDRLSGSVSLSGSGSVTVAAINGTSVTLSSSSSGRLTVHSLEATVNVDVSNGGSGAVVLGSLTTPATAIDNTGSGVVRVDSGEATQSADVTSKGSGAVTLGSLTTANATISSSGSGSVSGMTSRNLRVQTTGSGAITTSATESFHGSCSGSADVTIAGSARVSGSCLR